MELQKLYVTLTLEAKKYADGLRSAVGEAQRAGGRIAKVLGDGLKRAGQLMAAGIAVGAAALGAFLADGIRLSTDFNAQMSATAAVMNLTTEEIKPLADLAKDLAIDPRLKVSALEAADAIEMMAKNGLDMQTILDGAALSVVTLANATGGTFSQSADIATDVMELFNIEASDMMDAVDGITSVVNNSKFGINDYAAALANGGGTASMAGVSFSDFNATIASIAPSFGAGGDAATSFKSMLLSIASPTAAAKREMQNLGLSFYDANGNMKDMATISSELNNAMSGLTEQQRTAAMSTMFGAYGMRAANEVMKSGEVVYTDAATAVRELGVSYEDLEWALEGGITAYEAMLIQQGQTSALDSSAERINNLSGDLEIFKSVVQGVQLELGDKFQPALRSVVQAGTDFVFDFIIPAIQVVERFFERMELGLSPTRALAGALKQAGFKDIGDNVQFLSYKFFEMKDVVMEFIQPIIDFIAENVKLQDVAIALGIALATFVIPILGSMLLAIAGIMLPILAVIAVVALLRTAWENDWGGIQGKTAEAIEFVKGFISDGLAAISAWWSEHGAAVTATVTALWDFIVWAVGWYLTTSYENIKTLLTTIYEFWQTHGDNIIEAASKAWEAIKEAVQLVTGIILGLVSAFFSLIAGDFETAKETFTSTMSAAWEQIKEIFTNGIEGAKQIFNNTDWGAIGTSIMQGIAGGITAGLAWVRDAATNAAQSALDAARSLLRSNSPSMAFMDIGMDAGLGMAMGLESMQGAVSGAIGDMIPVNDYASASAMPMSGNGGGGSNYTASTTVNVASGDDPLRALRASRLLDKIGI